jgi:hypothetical protein
MNYIHRYKFHTSHFLISTSATSQMGWMKNDFPLLYFLNSSISTLLNSILIHYYLLLFPSCCYSLMKSFHSLTSFQIPIAVSLIAVKSLSHPSNLTSKKNWLLFQVSISQNHLTKLPHCNSFCNHHFMITLQIVELLEYFK